MEVSMRLTPPTTSTFLLSLIIAAVAVAMPYLPLLSSHIPLDKFYVSLIAYVILMAGNVIRGI
jgi:hypothetical protein